MTSSGPDAAVDLIDLRKRYRGVEALRGASIRVERGEIFGLLGPNGAGKSTLVKILLTLVRRTGGGGTVLGAPLGDRETLAKVGYLPENLRFPDYLTARQALDYFGALAKVPRIDRRRRGGELLELVGMRDWADRPVRTYSKGMRQRVGLAVSLVSDPELLVLDEPTDGVDPIGRKEIRDALLQAASTRSVLLNSHLLSEVEAMCGRIAILNQGQVVAQGPISELAGDERHDVEIAGSGQPLPGGLTSLVESMGGTCAAGAEGWHLRIPRRDAAEVQPIVDAARAAGRVITSLRASRASLEELFVRTVSDAGGGRPGGVLSGRGSGR
ncbi:MAG: ABC transporter ATP-binding protein [Phycisphaerae bacterium]|nr:ABC transporter ATP-binding protein [Phycisphaerae bacterium]